VRIVERVGRTLLDQLGVPRLDRGGPGDGLLVYHPR
jgi:hypothetical protein